MALKIREIFDTLLRRKSKTNYSEDTDPQYSQYSQYSDDEVRDIYGNEFAFPRKTEDTISYETDYEFDEYPMDKKVYWTKNKYMLADEDQRYNNDRYSNETHLEENKIELKVKERRVCEMFKTKSGLRVSWKAKCKKTGGSINSNCRCSNCRAVLLIQNSLKRTKFDKSDINLTDKNLINPIESITPINKLEEKVNYLQKKVKHLEKARESLINLRKGENAVKLDNKETQYSRVTIQTKYSRVTIHETQTSTKEFEKITSDGPSPAIHPTWHFKTRKEIKDDFKELHGNRKTLDKMLRENVRVTFAERSYADEIFYRKGVPRRTLKDQGPSKNSSIKSSMLSMSPIYQLSIIGEKTDANIQTEPSIKWEIISPIKSKHDQELSSKSSKSCCKDQYFKETINPTNRSNQQPQKTKTLSIQTFNLGNNEEKTEKLREQIEKDFKNYLTSNLASEASEPKWANPIYLEGQMTPVTLSEHRELSNLTENSKRKTYDIGSKSVTHQETNGRKKVQETLPVPLSKQSQRRVPNINGVHPNDQEPRSKRNDEPLSKQSRRVPNNNWYNPNDQEALSKRAPNTNNLNPNVEEPLSKQSRRVPNINCLNPNDEGMDKESILNEIRDFMEEKFKALQEKLETRQSKTKSKLFRRKESNCQKQSFDEAKEKENLDDQIRDFMEEKLRNLQDRFESGEPKTEPSFGESIIEETEEIDRIRDYMEGKFRNFESSNEPTPKSRAMQPRRKPSNESLDDQIKVFMMEKIAPVSQPPLKIKDKSTRRPKSSIQEDILQREKMLEQIRVLIGEHLKTQSSSNDSKKLPYLQSMLSCTTTDSMQIPSSNVKSTRTSMKTDADSMKIHDLDLEPIRKETVVFHSYNNSVSEAPSTCSSRKSNVVQEMKMRTESQTTGMISKFKKGSKIPVRKGLSKRRGFFSILPRSSRTRPTSSNLLETGDLKRSQQSLRSGIQINGNLEKFLTLLEKLNGDKFPEKNVNIIESLKKLDECHEKLEWLSNKL